MRSDDFKTFLEEEWKLTYKGKEKLTNGAINARLSRAGRLEKELETDLDTATQSLNELKELKQNIKDKYPKNVASTLYNAATRYYKFVHGIEPEKKHHEYLKL